MLALDVVLALSGVLTYVLAKTRCHCTRLDYYAAFNDPHGDTLRDERDDEEVSEIFQEVRSRAR